MVSKIQELAGEAMDDVTLDTILAKEPIKEVTKAEWLAVVERNRDDRAKWNLKQKKKGKEE